MRWVGGLWLGWPGKVQGINKMNSVGKDWSKTNICVFSWRKWLDFLVKHAKKKRTHYTTLYIYILYINTFVLPWHQPPKTLSTRWNTRFWFLGCLWWKVWYQNNSALSRCFATPCWASSPCAPDIFGSLFRVHSNVHNRRLYDHTRKKAIRKGILEL